MQNDYNDAVRTLSRELDHMMFLFNRLHDAPLSFRPEDRADFEQGFANAKLALDTVRTLHKPPVSTKSHTNR